MAPGRPDQDELKAAREFGAAVRKKLAVHRSLEEMVPLNVPGNRPYIEPEGLNRLKQMRQSAAVTPETVEALCTRCNRCIEACPEDAIDRVDVTRTDKERCMLCCACVKACPVGARRFAEPAFFPLLRKIQELCRERKEAKWYLS
jgi:ferredoxin